jgi:hypothetical protein
MSVKWFKNAAEMGGSGLEKESTVLNTSMLENVLKNTNTNQKHKPLFKAQI